MTTIENVSTHVIYLEIKPLEHTNQKETGSSELAVITFYNVRVEMTAEWSF